MEAGKGKMRTVCAGRFLCQLPQDLPCSGDISAVKINRRQFLPEESGVLIVISGQYGPAEHLCLVILFICDKTDQRFIVSAPCLRQSVISCDIVNVFNRKSVQFVHKTSMNFSRISLFGYSYFFR